MSRQGPGQTLEKIKSRARFSKVQRFSRPVKAPFRQDADYTIRKSLAEVVRDELLELKQELFFQRVFMFGKNSEKGLDIKSLKSMPSDLESRKDDFYENFRDLLESIIIHVENETFTEDKLNGMFLCMGEITLLVVEGDEDMVDEFFNTLVTNYHECWTATRIFLVEDKVKSVYFDAFICRRSAPVNVNEKFPTATPNDEYEMFIQHWKIKEKLHELCRTLSEQLREEDDSADSDEYLRSDVFNKLVPEVQRIELVFASKRFYRNLYDFSISYDSLTIQEGELDNKIWPMKYNYTPLGIFTSSEFDVNLTFGDYGKEEAKTAEREQSVIENEEEAAASNN